jgi:hypothetical protein
VNEGGERYVFTVVNNRAVKQRLSAGFEDPNNVEALSGFEVGTPVIVLGQSGLKDGSLVRSVNGPAVSATKSAEPTPPAPETDPTSKTTSTIEPTRPEKS